MLSEALGQKLPEKQREESVQVDPVLVAIRSIEDSHERNLALSRYYDQQNKARLEKTFTSTSRAGAAQVHGNTL